MADIARFDQYQVLMRKIGYSVGLESTLERLSDLSVLYSEKGRLTVGDWQELVGQKWNLKSDNIADFFGALGVINRTKSEITVLGGLDLITIASSGLEAPQQNVARSVALLLMLIEHDGEIFLNCLASGFENDRLVMLLEGLIQYKREKLFSMFRSPETQRELARIVGIERQVKNQGSAGGGKTLSDQRRSEPLAKRLDSLQRAEIPSVEISDDYLRKVPGRRRDWAVSLGLWDMKKGITENGHKLLGEINKQGLQLKSGAIVLWPFNHEISRLRLNPTEFEGKILKYWDLIRLAVVGLGGTVVDSTAPPEQLNVVGILIDHVKKFRELNRPKAMLRRELPFTIAYPSIAANLAARGLTVPNIPEIIEAERRADSSLIEVRTSRNSLGAVSIRS